MAGAASHPDPADETVSGPLAPLDRAATALDRMVPVAPTVDNAILVDSSRFTRWAGPLFAVCALVLVPWIIVIAATLPARQLSPNYDVAWAGYDVLLFAALTGTAVTALRRSPYLGMAGSWCAGLLTADAWFDVVTSPDRTALAEALAMAALVELPLTAVCIWLAKHSQDIAERRLTLLIHRRASTGETGLDRPAARADAARGRRVRPGVSRRRRSAS